jgi:hypothetical protein
MGAFDFIISQKAQLLQYVKDEHDLFSKTCRLYYPSIIVDCSTCADALAAASDESVRSSSFYLHGGQINSLGTCPSCGGTNSIAQESSEDIQMVVVTNLKKWIPNGNVNVRIPDSRILTRGKIEDFPKVQQCNRMVVQPELQSEQKFSYLLSSEPIDQNGFFKDNFFNCYWDRS